MVFCVSFLHYSLISLTFTISLGCVDIHLIICSQLQGFRKLLLSSDILCVPMFIIHAIFYLLLKFFRILPFVIDCVLHYSIIYNIRKEFSFTEKMFQFFFDVLFCQIRNFSISFISHTSFLITILTVIHYLVWLSGLVYHTFQY